ncbi:MAG TPA: hypothetical protein VGL91_01730 [Acidobacteriota bacterium]
MKLVRIPLTIGVLFAVLLLSGSAQASSKASLDASAAEKIIQKFVHVKTPPENKDWAWREERVQESLAANQKVVKVSSAIYEWRIQGEKRESRLVEVNGKPKALSFVEEIPATDLSDWDFEKVARRFDFKIIKFEKIQNRDVARIHFSPKKRQPRPRGRLEKIVSRLEGDLWVVVEEQQLVKAYAQLSEPVKFGGGILGEVSALEINYSQRPIDDQWLPESFQFEIHKRELLSSARFRERRIYSGHQETSNALSRVGPQGW